VGGRKKKQGGVVLTQARGEGVRRKRSDVQQAKKGNVGTGELHD